jgi:hypothetical protein
MHAYAWLYLARILQFIMQAAFLSRCGELECYLARFHERDITSMTQYDSSISVVQQMK